MKISYSAVIKNPRRKKAPYYGRIRQDGRERFIPLNTESKSEAMKWVERQKNILFQVNELIEAGLPVPDDLMAKLLTVDTPAFAQKVASKPVSAPGGILERWEVDMRIRGFSDTTIINYLKSARIVLGDAPLDTLGADRVRDAISRNLDISNNTRRFYCNALRCLFRFIGRDDLVKKLGLPLSGLHCIRRSRAQEIYRRCGLKVASQMLGDSETVALKHYIKEVGVEEIRKEVYGEG